MNILKSLEIYSLFNIMSDKCPKCPDCSQNNVLDVAGNIFSKDLLIPMNFTESTGRVEPYNEQSQGIMPYQSLNVKESYDVYSEMEKYDDKYSLNAQIKDQIESILRRNFDLKTTDIPYSTHGGNN